MRRLGMLGMLFLLVVQGCGFAENEAKQPRPVSSATAALTTNPSWKLLVLIYTTADVTYTDASGTHRVVATMTSEDVARAQAAAQRFAGTDVPALTSGFMVPTVTIRQPARALNATQAWCGGYWPAPTDNAADLDPAFDSVLVVWPHVGTDQAGASVNLQGGCGGGTWPMGTAQTYTAIPINSVSADQENVFKHEWGHAILYYTEAAGTAPLPAVDNHIDATTNMYVNCLTGLPYVLQDETNSNPIPSSIYNNAQGFTHDYYSGLTATADMPSRCLGIPDSAWAQGGPVSKGGTAPGVTALMASPAQLFAPPGGTASVTLSWQGGPTALSEKVFVHVYGPANFGHDYWPSVATTSWSGNVSQQLSIALPPTAPTGTYAINVGLYDANGTQARLPLGMGPGVTTGNDGDASYRVGTLDVSTLRVTAPISGQNVNRGSKLRIQWVETNVHSTNGSTYVFYNGAQLASVPLGRQQYTWSVPKLLAPGAGSLFIGAWDWNTSSYIATGSMSINVR